MAARNKTFECSCLVRFPIEKGGRMLSNLHNRTNTLNKKQKSEIVTERSGTEQAANYLEATSCLPPAAPSADLLGAIEIGSESNTKRWQAQWGMRCKSCYQRIPG